jgi:hypothetical protein
MSTALEESTVRVMESLMASHGMVSKKLETFLEGWCQDSSLVNPQDAFIGPDGEPWAPLGYAGGVNQGAVYSNPAELLRIRQLARWFADENEFANNSHENRINYIAGWGHTYNVVAKPGEDVPDDAIDAVREIMEEFLKLNLWSPCYVRGSLHASGRAAWGYRQQQNVLRRDRDGEVIIRKFKVEDGILRLRYVEPEALFTPESLAGRDNVQYGIEVDPNDEETVVAYHVNRQSVDAADIQHRCRSASSRHPRGIPIHYAVRKNLVRASKILRNGSTVTEIQTAIGLIRKHLSATQASVSAFQQSLTQARDTTDTPPRRQQFKPGTILDTSGNTEYVIPGMGIDPSKYVAALQAELRAIASRLVMPEFMLSSDASNANFASTMVAEGPASKNFERLQWDEICCDLELIWDALAWAAQSGRLDHSVLERIDIVAEPPSARARNQVEDAQVVQVLDGLGVISKQTLSAQFGLDYEQEQANIETHNEDSGIPLSFDRPELPPLPGDQQPPAKPGDQQPPARETGDGKAAK